MNAKWRPFALLRAYRKPRRDAAEEIPEIQNDRGILSVNAPRLTSRLLPLGIGLISALVLAALWLAPYPAINAGTANSRGIVKVSDRFDESSPPIQLVPANSNSQPALDPVTAHPDGRALQSPPPPIAIVPAIDTSTTMDPPNSRISNQAPLGPPANLLLSQTPEANPSALLSSTSGQTARIASHVTDRTLTISEGSFLDCVLETALSSDVPGLTSCRLTRDIYGDDGRVVLLERSTQLIGAYQSGLEQGRSRLQVIWTRARTPIGVTINLDSQGTDALGRAGLAGYLDNHFWERFGAAVFLSSLDDFSTIVSARRANSGAGTVYPQNTAAAAQGAAAIAVGNDVRIQPTLIKNQGDHINVFVAHDLDFGQVYQVFARQ
jgi:type IV secretion system protein VirB10